MSMFTCCPACGSDYCSDCECVRAEVARLTAERDQLKGQIELLNAAVEGALRRAERAEDALKGRS